MRVAPTLDEHPRLDAGFCETVWDTPLGGRVSPDWLAELSALDAPTPLRPDDEVRQAVRRLLRHGGYRPSGRGKPSSEYLLRASGAGTLGAINPAVDVCNVVSLHSGLPISVVDLERTRGPLRVGLAAAGSSYAFNPAGQVIRLDGLLCLHDADGPCANAVKDSQRTKTHAGTTRTLSVVWGTVELPGRTAATLTWYRQVLDRLRAGTTETG